MAAFTVALPHKRNPGNDRALAIALDCLFTNTVNDFHLLIDAAEDEPLYPRMNRLIAQAETDCVVYTCSDIFHAPGWDVPMLAAWDYATFVMGVLVEPGAIGAHPENITRDFGRRPETFDRAGFEAYTLEAPVPSGTGFPAPMMMSRMRVLDLGGYNEITYMDGQGFTDADLVLISRHAHAGGVCVRAPAYFYHLQRYSELAEQTKDGR
jgi:hypothetical protein